MDEKLQALAATDLFAGLDKKHLEAIGRVTDQVSVDAGRQLIRQGQVTTHMAIIIDGEASVDVDGSEVATLGAGEVIGELSMVDGEEASATVTTSAPSQLWLIARAGFLPVWEDSPEMSTPMLLAVVKRLRETNRQLHG